MLKRLSVLGLLAASGLTLAAPPLGDWRLYRIGDLHHSTLIERQSAPTLRFEGGRVIGNAGCNSFFGSATFSGQSVKIGALGSTRRACANRVQGALESRFLRSLGQVNHYGLSGPVMTLVTVDGQVLSFRQGR